MAVITLLILLLSSWQYVCGQEKCTKAHLCNSVEAEVCDNSKCLEVAIDDIHEIINKGAKVHDFNILRPPFTNNCTFKVKYEPKSDSDVTNAVNATFSTYIGDIGELCSSEVSLSRVFSGDIDSSGGTIRLLTADIGGETFEDCFTYIEKGVGLVYRRCVVDSSHDPCAAIYSVEVEEGDESGIDTIHEFLEETGVDMSKTVAECHA